MATPIIHAKDADCTVGPDDCCIECGVAHGDVNEPGCPDCGGHGFHSQPGAEGPFPCGWTGEKQAPAKRVTEPKKAEPAIAQWDSIINGQVLRYERPSEKDEYEKSFEEWRRDDLAWKHREVA